MPYTTTLLGNNAHIRHNPEVVKRMWLATTATTGASLVKAHDDPMFEIRAKREVEELVAWFANGREHRAGFLSTTKNLWSKSKRLSEILSRLQAMADERRTASSEPPNKRRKLDPSGETGSLPPPLQQQQPPSNNQHSAGSDQPMSNEPRILAL